MTDSRRRSGQVVAFDEWVGLGTVEADGDAGVGPGAATHLSDPVRFPFHCTQLADGSRTVALGTRVDFRLLAGRGGRWEAADIRPTGGGQ